MPKYCLFFALLLMLSCTETAPPAPESTADPTRLNVAWKEVAALPPAPADHRIAYGPDSLQFGELRLPPEGEGPFPVVVFIHGGCWLAQFDLTHVGPVSADLAARGYAVWTPEYRRVGDTGGGWPGTFLDIGRAVDHLRILAKEYPLDLNEVTVMGHSAGGHLAIWQAQRAGLPEDSPLYVPDPLPVSRVVSLAGITDLVAYNEVGNSCSVAVPKLMGGSPSEQPELYRQASPATLGPGSVPVWLIHGTEDAIVPPEQSSSYAALAGQDSSRVRLVTISGGGHFDLVHPASVAWEEVVRVAAGR